MQENTDRVFKLKALERWENEGGRPLSLSARAYGASSSESFSEKPRRENPVCERSQLDERAVRKIR